MSLAQQYDALYRAMLRTVATHGFTVDEQIGSPGDRRYGITLRIRPPAQVRERIADFVEAVRVAEPRQYVYPASDMHVTVLSIITCYAGFALDQIDVPSYIRLIAGCLAEQRPFAIDYRGVTASPACLMIQGFPQGDALDTIRDRVRRRFRASDLEQTIDLRYETTLAHSTVVRFRRPVADPGALLALLAAYRSHDFGTGQVDALELVANDWYHTCARGQLLATFPLGG